MTHVLQIKVLSCAGPAWPGEASCNCKVHHNLQFLNPDSYQPLPPGSLGGARGCLRTLLASSLFFTQAANCENIGGLCNFILILAAANTSIKHYNHFCIQIEKGLLAGHGRQQSMVPAAVVLTGEVACITSACVSCLLTRRSTRHEHLSSNLGTGRSCRSHCTRHVLDA